MKSSGDVHHRSIYRSFFIHTNNNNNVTLDQSLFLSFQSIPHINSCLLHSFTIVYSLNTFSILSFFLFFFHSSSTIDHR